MTGHDHSRAHDHDHEHEHGHAHEHEHEAHRHTAGEGPTVLDIGGDVGALVLYTSVELVGAEIEISPVGAPDVRRHVAVHPRQYPGGTAYAAVYYGLQEGGYELWAADGTVAMMALVEGDAITEAVWPEGVLAPR
jgi:hypothetical protein